MEQDPNRTPGRHVLQTAGQQGQAERHFWAINYTSNLQISLAWSDVFEKFKNTGINSLVCLSLKIGPRSLAPQGAKLWPFRVQVTLAVRGNSAYSVDRYHTN